MEEFRKQALDKMLQEMNEKHSSSEDKIHNWLCNQENDEELMKSIFKEGKTIKSALGYAKSKARKEAEDGVATIDDDVVYGWVREYYLSDVSEVKVDSSVPTRKLSAKEKKETAEREKRRIAAEKKKAEEKTKKEHQKELKKLGVVEDQISLFDDMFNDSEAKA
jgi:hypothetical protein